VHDKNQASSIESFCPKFVSVWETFLQFLKTKGVENIFDGAGFASEAVAALEGEDGREFLCRGCETRDDIFHGLRRIIRDYDIWRLSPRYWERAGLTPQRLSQMTERQRERLSEDLKQLDITVGNKRRIAWAFDSEDVDPILVKLPRSSPVSAAEFLCGKLKLADLEAVRSVLLLGYKRSELPGDGRLRTPTPIDGLGLDLFQSKPCNGGDGGRTASEDGDGLPEAVHSAGNLRASVIVLVAY